MPTMLVMAMIADAGGGAMLVIGHRRLRGGVSAARPAFTATWGFQPLEGQEAPFL
jgi:hypothetical protein